MAMGGIQLGPHEFIPAHYRQLIAVDVHFVTRNILVTDTAIKAMQRVAVAAAPRKVCADMILISMPRYRYVLAME